MNIDGIIEFEAQSTYSGDLYTVALDPLNKVIYQQKNLIYIMLSMAIWIVSIIFYLLNFESISIACSLLLFSFVGTTLLINTIKEFSINVDFLMLVVAVITLLGGHYLEGSLLLTLFFAANQFFQFIQVSVLNLSAVKHRTFSGSVLVKKNENFQSMKEISRLGVGDVIIVRYGDIVPCEAVSKKKVLLSTAGVNGESTLVATEAGDVILAGSINLGHDAEFVVTAPFSSSIVQEIMKAVSQKTAEETSNEIISQSALKKYSILLVLAFALCILYYTFFQKISFFGKAGSLYKATSFLTILSPCAIIVPIPIAYLCFAVFLYREGLLIRDLKRIISCSSDIYSVLFDKTGTLTYGNLNKMYVNSFEIVEGKMSLQEIAAFVFEVEKTSKHPIGRCLLAWSRGNCSNMHKYSGKSQVEFTGSAFEGFVDGKKVYIGKPDDACTECFVCKIKISIADTLAYASIESCLRRNASVCVDMIEKEGSNVAMVTGDHSKPSFQIAEKAHIRHVHHSMSSNEKIIFVKKCQERGATIMVGDGINDTLSLKQADIGIAMAGDNIEFATIYAASAIIMGDNILSVALLIKQKKKLQKIIFFNFYAAISLIVLGFFLIIVFSLNLGSAVVIHEGGTIVLSLHALRLLRK